ncbi:MAG: PHP domain-containing protein [Kiritimatiellae bacterium]|nr:PHP domain-containing protein [Verrucomicrobiota bacterium]MBU4366873.1 PHP domain-containing protein [Verrucomicrobiota bacterium]MCG2660324.1 PHP domain-containing protein [Kiritimatiellia bacterium]
MIDLHTHSTFSDGSLTPEQLVREAERARLSALALTDHDSISGLERFIAACSKSIVRGVPGVEISVDCNPSDATMHILGYFIDPANAELNEHVNRLRDGRQHRNEEILKRLNAMGLMLNMNEISSFAGENNVGRLHFAQALMVRGYVRTTQEAFDKYLAKGKSGYANRLRFKPIGGVEMIRQAGGIAVLAHPFTLNLGKQALADRVGELVQAGLQGIEIYYPQHSPKQVRQYLDLAAQFHLVATGGTDFHGTPMPDVRLGRGFGVLDVPNAVLEQLDALRS